jgi:hypothetical protein
MDATSSTGAPERARWPRLAAAPQSQPRSLLRRGYAGFTEATAPRRLVLPATTSVPLVVKLRDSRRTVPSRRSVMGVHGSSTALEGLTGVLLTDGVGEIELAPDPHPALSIL